MGGIAAGLKRLLGIGRIDEAFFEGLEDSLIEGDVGASLAIEISAELRGVWKRDGSGGEEGVKAALRSIVSGMLLDANVLPDSRRLNIYLLLGVNGVGKTTTSAKLATLFSRSIPKEDIILAACDTFRAGAVDQLAIHGERIGVRVVANRNSSDPGAIVYDAIKAAKAQDARVVIADTAGRIHTKANLIKELEKIDKIAKSQAGDASFRKLLVMDATTGQNGLAQAQTFAEAVGVDAVVLAKYDSSAKGGLVLSISRQLAIPTAFLGTGEGYGDLKAFSREEYVRELVG
jgi:fused signal recognition particle receptor